MRTTSTLLTRAVLVWAGATFGACGDDARTGDPGDTTDTAVDTTPEEIDVAEDVADTTEETRPEVTPAGPLARVYPLAPGLSELAEVTLEHLDEPHDTLIGAYASVRSCTWDLERGKRTDYDFGLDSVEIVSCVPEAKARPDGDGTYLSIAPPSAPAEDDGRFAEVMMYHHMQVIHDYFKEIYGLTSRDEPLAAMTNVAISIEGCEGWTGVENAAYVPQMGLDYFVEGLDVSGIRGDAILFSGTADKNFAFDASVIYHEYTHAMVGATRLTGVFLDDEGLNSLPGALNEAYADYFAATQTEEPTIGRYALEGLAVSDFCGLADEDAGVSNYSRDLRAQRRCPDDLVSEVHADSEIFSSALWAIRERFGKLQGDTIVLYAALELTDKSDFVSAAKRTVDGSGELYGAEAAAAVQAIFDERNLLECDRVVPIERVGERDIELRVEGTRAFDPNPFPGYVPGYVQFGVVVPDRTTTVTITLDATAGGFASNGQPLEVDAVVKRGAAPVTYSYGATAGSVTHDGDFTFTVTDKAFVIKNANGVPLAPGAWTFALHNKARRTLRIYGITAVSD